MRFRLNSALAAAAVAAVMATALTGGAAAQSGAPIKIGFSMAMTGGLAANGKSALLAQKIWEEDVNAKGGLLGRPVKLVYYDDQSNPSTVPGAKEGRDLLIADTGLTERTNLLDIFLTELGRLASASFAAGAFVSARQSTRHVPLFPQLRTS